MIKSANITPRHYILDLLHTVPSNSNLTCPHVEHVRFMCGTHMVHVWDTHGAHNYGTHGHNGVSTSIVEWVVHTYNYVMYIIMYVPTTKPQ